MQCGNSGIAEQIEEVPTAGLPPQPRSERPVVEEQTGIQIIVQINQHLDPPLPDNKPLTGGLQALILIPPSLAQALLYRDLLARGGPEDVSRARHKVCKALCRFLLGNLFGRRILGNV